MFETLAEAHWQSSPNPFQERRREITQVVETFGRWMRK